MATNTTTAPPATAVERRFGDFEVTGRLKSQDGLYVDKTSAQLVVKPVDNAYTVTFAEPGNTRTINFSDPGSSPASMIYDVKAQTISGAKTFSAAITETASSNQLVFQPGGTGTNTTISVTQPSANKIVTLPDPGTDCNFVLTRGTQTISGATTFASAVTVQPTTNQLVLGVTNTTTISATAPSASRTYTLPDVGQSTDVLLGVKQFGTAITGAIGLSASDSGKIYKVNATAGPYNITLPTPTTSGLVFEFVITTAAAQVISITTGAGSQMTGNGIASTSAIAGGATDSNITFGSSAAVGSYIRCMSNGTTYTCFGHSVTAAGIAFV